MNLQWMRDRLEAYESVLDEWRRAVLFKQSLPISTRDRAITDFVTVQKIVKLVDPTLAEGLEAPREFVDVVETLRVIHQALGAVRDWYAMAENLAPDAPSLVADQFHLHVWPAAAPLWDTGQYRVAVQ